MAAPVAEGVEVRVLDGRKGKGLYAKTAFQSDESILEESPVVSCQFSWNELYKYKACEYCMRSLEPAESMAQRLTENPALILPYPDCCTVNLDTIVVCPQCQSDESILKESPVVSCQFSWNELYKYKACEYCMRSLEPAESMAQRLTENPALILPYPDCCTVNLDTIVVCPQCQVLYCNEECRQLAWKSYHQYLCMGSAREDPDHPVNKLLEVWRNMHYPPETASIMLLLKMIGMVKQWLTPEGFRSLFALMGTNQQGIGSSSISVWVKNCDKLTLEEGDREQLDSFIDQMYDDLDRVSGTFLNCEGAGLYRLQSACNHSCDPNAEIQFNNENHTLTLVALTDISPEQEICISYLGECDQNRSRHSRQKLLRENYLFTCDCMKCLSQADDDDVTSDESEDEDDEMEDEDEM